MSFNFSPFSSAGPVFLEMENAAGPRAVALSVHLVRCFFFLSEAAKTLSLSKVTVFIPGRGQLHFEVDQKCT
jgi:hypothetical protein